MSGPILMVDVDGVLVHAHGGGHWSDGLEARLGVSAARLQAGFFSPAWEDIALGRADLFEKLAPALAEIAPEVSPQALVDDWFATDSRLDEALLADLGALRRRGIEMHLATVQEHHRARYLWETLGLRDHFAAIHYSADVGFAKPEAGFFHAVAARIGRPGPDLLLLDDRQGNIEGARACGWEAVLWDGTRRLAEILPERFMI